MKKLLTNNIVGGVGMPLKSGSLDHIQNAYAETTEDLVKAVLTLNGYTDFTKAYIIQGLTRSLGGSNWNYTAGVVFYQGELFRVAAQVVPVVGGQDQYLSPLNTFVTGPNADAVEFTDGVPRSVHVNRAFNILNSATPPDSNLVYTNLIRLQNNGAVGRYGTSTAAPAVVQNLTGSVLSSELSVSSVGKVITVIISVSVNVTGIPALSPSAVVFFGWAISSVPAFADGFADTSLPSGFNTAAIWNKQGTATYEMGRLQINETAVFLSFLGQFPSTGVWNINLATISYAAAI